MLPALSTMSAHGASVFSFESAGGVSRSQEIVAAWGGSGKGAAWWQLAFDTPFLIAYGLFAAGACAAVSRRAEQAGRLRLCRVASVIAWFGPLAATADCLQNVSLALILSGHVAQPWPRIAAICGSLVSILMGVALLFSLIGWALTRRGLAGASRPATTPAGDE